MKIWQLRDVSQELLLDTPITDEPQPEFSCATTKIQFVQMFPCYKMSSIIKTWKIFNQIKHIMLFNNSIFITSNKNIFWHWTVNLQLLCKYIFYSFIFFQGGQLDERVLLLAACHLLNVFNYYCVECICC